MCIYREVPPTAGFSLGIRDYWSLLKPSSYTKTLEDDFKEYLGVSYARVTYSGTAALYFILETLKIISQRRTVVIPSYVCPLVPLAIARAGFTVAICDMNGESFDYNTTELEVMCKGNPDVAAVIVVHLAGMPLDMEKIQALTTPRGIFVIEDCAQSLGAEYKKRKVGSWGDFSFFSLCRGKGLTVYEGGVAVAGQSRYAEILERTIQSLEKKDFLAEAVKIIELFGYGFFYRPLLFWFVFSLPRMFWESRGNVVRAYGEDFGINFPVHRVSGIRKVLGHATFCRLDREIEKQREKARYFQDQLRDVPGVRILPEPSLCRGTYPYLTVFFDDPGRRDIVLHDLERKGLGVSLVYVHAITAYPYLRSIVGDKKFSVGSKYSRSALTISTSVFVRKEDMDSVISVLRKN
ncbi:MAG: DegT/DnrJ/EryC1/StrS aminotransferase family protein [Candidatus Omnitrophica bacterium]|nr:DegT/DnrJ/EryC1/StrS aminotransferase family protein [Candidatus Omnitrophota bacterium]